LIEIEVDISLLVRVNTILVTILKKLNCFIISVSLEDEIDIAPPVRLEVPGVIMDCGIGVHHLTFCK